MQNFIMSMGDIIRKGLAEAESSAIWKGILRFLVFVFHACVFIFVPAKLPEFKQRMLAIFSALLSGLFAFFLPGTIGLEIEGIESRFGEINVEAAGGIAVFLLVLVWWLSPWAPVGKEVKKKLNDIKSDTEEIRSDAKDMKSDIQEIKSGVDSILEKVLQPINAQNAQIVSPQGQMEHLQTQTPSSRARELAEQIQTDADSYALGLKALAESRFDDARRHLEEAEKGTEAEQTRIYIARGRTELYAGSYKDAVGWYQKALVLNPEDPDILNETALALYYAGNYREAEPLYKRSLAIREKALGKDHPHVAASLNNLAGLYQAQGKYVEAEALYERSLAIREKALGKDHPDVATSLNNLAGLYQAQGKYAEAEPLYKRSLAILEKALGKDHPDVATVLENLAVLYEKIGKEDEAK